jgi:excisionase family DNA binding protein
MPERLLTVDEIAELLRLNPQTVRNMIDRRELGAVRLGQRRVRVRESELERFLAAGEMPADRGDQPDREPGAVARDQFISALSEILRRARTQDPAELASALREVAAAAEALADTLQPSD